MEPIKSCPFCGGRAVLRLMKSEAYSGDPRNVRLMNKYQVECEKCGASTPVQSSDISQDNRGMIHIDKNGADRAIAIWNRRNEEIMFIAGRRSGRSAAQLEAIKRRLEE